MKCFAGFVNHPQYENPPIGGIWMILKITVGCWVSCFPEYTQQLLTWNLPQKLIMKAKEAISGSNSSFFSFFSWTKSSERYPLAIKTNSILGNLEKCMQQTCTMNLWGVAMIEAGKNKDCHDIRASVLAFFYWLKFDLGWWFVSHFIADMHFCKL